MNIILTIAGSDPSGGAGIQADIKTITSLGCFAAAAITTITCQNSLGVQRIAPLEPALVQQQISSVLDDNTVSHIKIGMTGSHQIIQAIDNSLASFTGEIILDPVLKASSGTSLLNDNPQALTPLLQKATVLTPNTQELGFLSNLACNSRKSSIEAGKTLLTNFSNLRVICLKGGHLNESKDMVEDILLKRSGDAIIEESLQHPRHHTRNSHGTGCTFASAFTCFHHKYNDDQKAFTGAVSYVDALLQQGKEDQLGAGTGGLAHYRQNRSRR